MGIVMENYLEINAIRSGNQGPEYMLFVYSYKDAKYKIIRPVSQGSPPTVAASWNAVTAYNLKLTSSSFCSLSYDSSIDSSKESSTQIAIKYFLFQLPVSSLSLRLLMFSSSSFLQ
jgi:hypothetical protein